MEKEGERERLRGRERKKKYTSLFSLSLSSFSTSKPKQTRKGGLRRRHHHRPRHRGPRRRAARGPRDERRRRPLDGRLVSPQLQPRAVSAFNLARGLPAPEGGLQGVRQRAEGAAHLGEGRLCGEGVPGGRRGAAAAR